MSALTSRRALLGGAAVAAAALSLPLRDALAGPVTHEVRIKGFVFEPADLEVRIGDTVRWINDDLAPHTATAQEFGWDTGPLERGQTGEVTVIDGMEVDYFCVFHPHMVARLRIV